MLHALKYHFHAVYVRERRLLNYGNSGDCCRSVLLEKLWDHLNPVGSNKSPLDDFPQRRARRGVGGLTAFQ